MQSWPLTLPAKATKAKTRLPSKASLQWPFAVAGDIPRLVIRLNLKQIRPYHCSVSLATSLNDASSLWYSPLKILQRAFWSNTLVLSHSLCNSPQWSLSPWAIRNIFWHFVAPHALQNLANRITHCTYYVTIYGKKALFQQLFSHNVALFSTGGGAQKSQNTQEGLKIDTRIFLSVEGGPQHTFLFYFEPFFLGRDFCVRSLSSTT